MTLMRTIRVRGESCCCSHLCDGQMEVFVNICLNIVRFWRTTASWVLIQMNMYARFALQLRGISFLQHVKNKAIDQSHPVRTPRLCDA